MITALTITSNVIHSQVQLKAAWFKLEVKSRKNEKVSSTPPHQTSFDHDAIISDNTPPPCRDSRDLNNLISQICERITVFEKEICKTRKISGN